MLLRLPVQQHRQKVRLQGQQLRLSQYHLIDINTVAVICAHHIYAMIAAICCINVCSGSGLTGVCTYNATTAAAKADRGEEVVGTDHIFVKHVHILLIWWH